MIAALLFASAIAATETHSERPHSLSDLRCGRPPPYARGDDIVDAFDQRSIQIIAAASRGAAQDLGRFVAPELTSLVFNADVGLRSEGKGAAAVIELAQRIRPEGYQITHQRGAPLNPWDPCADMTVSMTVMSSDGAVYVVRFRYKARLLVDISASDVDFVEGDFKNAHR